MKTARHHIKTQQPTDAKHAVYADLLRTRGLKATNQRMVLLDVLGSARAPLSLRDIETNPRTHHINQSTLYRVIKDYIDTGIVRPVDLRHAHAHYELVSNHEHHHIICTSCGTVEDFTETDCALRTRLIMRKSKKFKTITDHAFDLYGVCVRCS